MGSNIPLIGTLPGARPRECEKANKPLNAADYPIMDI
jgi:hypothetical protein